MKKRFLLYFIIGCFLWMPNVFGYTELSVCNSGCYYSNLDDALYAVNDYYGDVYIYLNDSGSYTISDDHMIDNVVRIYLDNYDISIDGEGSTIYTNYGVYFSSYSYDYNLEISDLNFECESLYADYGSTCLYFDSIGKVSLSNVKIKNNDFDPFDTSTVAISFVECKSYEVDSVFIEDFFSGIITEYGNGKLNIKNSDLTRCVFSIFAINTNISIENSDLSFLGGFNSIIKMNLSEDKKIIHRYVNERNVETILNEIIEAYEDREYEDNIYLVFFEGDGEPFYEKINKTITLESNEINLLDIWFGEDEFSKSDFDIENSNTGVVSVNDGVVKPLMNGTSEVKLINKENDNKYTLYITVNNGVVNPVNPTNPILPNVNPKTFNSILMYGLLFIIMVSSIGVFVLKKKH